MFFFVPVGIFQKVADGFGKVRMWAIAKAFEEGMGVEEVHTLTNIDRWFLSKLHGLHMLKGTMRRVFAADG